jgi:hypothetical protein
MILALLLFAAGIQDYTHRGFLENRLTLYPQEAPNDQTHAVGEMLFRYEGFYKPANAVQIAGAVDLRTDTHHQVERELGSWWDDRGRKRPAATLRRLSALFYSGPLTVEAGKQFIRWGKTDILTPTDRFAPRDFLTVFDNEFLAVTALRATYEKGANTIDIVWAPRFTPSRIPLVEHRWIAAPSEVTIPDAGAQFPGGPQTGIRWSHTGAIEYSASLYQGFNHLPAISVSPAGLRRHYRKLVMAGGDMLVPLPWLSIKGEAAYIGSADQTADEYVQYVVQLERQTGEWFFVGGYAGEIITERGIGGLEFAIDRGFTETFLGRAGYTIDANRSIALETAARQNGDGVWVRFEYSQAFGQHWRATLGASLIRGEPMDFIGQYRRNSNAVVVVRYSF